MLVDSHCHLNMLDLSPFDGELGGVIQAAKEADVTKMLCVAVDLENFPAVLQCAENYLDIFASVGVHPNDSQDSVNVKQLVELSQHDKVVAIGETGLDYFRSEGDLEWQRDAFRAHITVAKETQKPLIIHTREAREDTLQLMREEQAETIGGVIHCFTETWEMAQAAIELGFYISFSGIVTFKNAKDLQDVAKKIPLEKMLIETDSPYLAPVPHRGKANYPAYVRYVAEFIAELRNEPLAKIAQQTTENFQRLFKIN